MWTLRASCGLQDEVLTSVLPRLGTEDVEFDLKIRIVEDEVIESDDDDYEEDDDDLGWVDGGHKCGVQGFVDFSLAAHTAPEVVV